MLENRECHPRLVGKMVCPAKNRIFGGDSVNGDRVALLVRKDYVAVGNAYVALYLSSFGFGGFF